MCVKRSVYVAGFERGVRPIGFWSISITLSNASTPSTEAWSPGFTRARFSRLARAADDERAAVLVAPRRDRDRPLAGEELPRDRALRALDARGRALGDDVA